MDSLLMLVGFILGTTAVCAYAIYIVKWLTRVEAENPDMRWPKIRLPWGLTMAWWYGPNRWYWMAEFDRIHAPKLGLDVEHINGERDFSVNR